MIQQQKINILEKCCILEKSRKTLVKFGENSAKFWQNFGKKQQKFQQFLTKFLRLESGAKECIVQISARAFQRVFTCKIWLRYSRERAYLISLILIRPWSFNFHRALQPAKLPAFVPPGSTASLDRVPLQTVNIGRFLKTYVGHPLPLFVNNRS